MNAYAYISIFDAILKMSVAYLLIVSPVDKLIAYSVLLFVTALGVRLLYGFYCGRHFKECKYKPIYDRVLFKEMMGFAGWNFFGNATMYFLVLLQIQLEVLLRRSMLQSIS